MNWSYKREEQTFKPLQAGDYRIRVKDVEMAISKNGNDMMVVQFEVSGSTQILYHYIVFMPDRPEITNRNLTQFYDSFKDIVPGDTNTANWIGKVGAAKVKLEEYNGEMKPRISYFIRSDKAVNLPAWQEPGVQSGNPSTTANVDLNDVPF